MEQDKSYLEMLLKGIVNFPEAVRVERTVDEMGVLMLVHADPRDMGLIIGKQGTIANAIRVLVRSVGMKTKARVNVKIMEPEGSLRAGPNVPDTRVPLEQFDPSNF